VRRTPARFQGGVRSRSVAVVWLVLLVLAMIVAVAALVLVFSRDPTGGEASAPRPGERGTAGRPRGRAGDASTGGGAGAVRPPDVRVRFRGPVRNYEGGVRTLLYGWVRNTGEQHVSAVEVEVSALDAEGKRIGQIAPQVVRDIPPGVEAPFVMTWVHPEGVQSSKWTWQHRVNPPDLVREPSGLELASAVFLQFERGSRQRGKVAFRVENRGTRDVRVMRAFVHLKDAAGRVIGAAEAELKEGVPAGQGRDVAVEYEDTPQSKIEPPAEVWVQWAY
jgi:hypothetical protein